MIILVSGHAHFIEESESDSITQHYSFWHVDTRSKLLIILICIITLSFTISYEQLLLYFFLFTLFLILFQGKLKQILLKSLVPFPLILGLTLFTFLNHRNGGSLQFTSVIVTYSSIEITLFWFVRSLLLVYFALLLIESEHSFIYIISALSGLKVIPKILTNLLLLTYRSTLDLRLEAERMLAAQKCRGFNRGHKFNLSTLRLIGYMIGGLITRVLSREKGSILYSRGFVSELPIPRQRMSFFGIFVLWITSMISISSLLYSNIAFLSIGTFS